MTNQYKTIEIRIPEVVMKKISLLASEEGRGVEAMIGILLEDALALRVTSKSAAKKVRPGDGRNGSK